MPTPSTEDLSKNSTVAPRDLPSQPSIPRTQSTRLQPLPTHPPVVRPCTKPLDSFFKDNRLLTFISLALLTSSSLRASSTSGSRISQCSIFLASPFALYVIGAVASPALLGRLARFNAIRMRPDMKTQLIAFGGRVLRFRRPRRLRARRLLVRILRLHRSPSRVPRFSSAFCGW